MKPSRPKKAKTKLYDNSRRDKQQSLEKALEKWESENYHGREIILREITKED